MVTVIWGSSFVISKDTLDTLPASLLGALRSGVALIFAALLLCTLPLKTIAKKTEVVREVEHET
jgi:drug/metabolite transporter (DMT)-like permease